MPNPSYFPFAQNLRLYERGIVGPRIPMSPQLVLGDLAQPVHSLRRLNDTTPGAPSFQFVYVFGIGNRLYTGDTGGPLAPIVSGFSGDRLSLVPFRPNASPRAWMYVGDSVLGVKVDAEGDEANTGIIEPQNPATAADGGASATGPTMPVFYRYIWRSSATGAKSNPSPPMRTGFNISGHAVLVQTAVCPDPQGDLADVFRQDPGLLNYTYIGTVPAGSVLTDNVNDAVVAANPQMEFDNFEPFPSIDLPANGVVTVTGAHQLTWVSGDKFNVRWLPGNLMTLNFLGIVVTFYNRPSSPTVLTTLEDLTASIGTTGTYTLAEPSLAAQRLPALWGPTDNTGFIFGCGDSLRPGTLYFTKGNNPDSAPDTNQIEVTSPSEPLMNGCVVGGLSLVFSTERAWLIYPNFTSALSTVIGLVGSIVTLIQSIAQRGLYAKNGICTDGGRFVYFISKDGIYESHAGFGAKSITDEIYSLFPHEGSTPQAIDLQGTPVQPPNYQNPNGMALSFADGHLYFDYQDLAGNFWSLVFDSRLGWSVDVPGLNGSQASVHAPQEGNAYGTILGCVDGSVRILESSGTEVVTMIAQTEFLSHGLPDFESLAELNLSYLSNDVITLSFTPDQGQAIANLAIPVSLTQAKAFSKIGTGKFKLMRYGISILAQNGNSTPPRIWLDEFQVKIGAWARDDMFKVVKPFDVFLKKVAAQ